MKVLVIGASGLLGSRMMRVFPADWEVTGTCRSRPGPGLLQCSVTDSRSVAGVIGGANYDWVVHCAAIRSPDACEKDPRYAMEVNAEGVRKVALAAADCGARVAYASTDYVFPGTAPPYAEDDAPAPINVYGNSKVAGEHYALGVPGSLVVRMPALYSLDLEAPGNLLGALRSSLAGGRPVKADDVCTRYYTLAEEVAAAFACLMERRQTGVVHVSAQEPCTKLRFLKDAARAMGLQERLVEEAAPEPSLARRPLDSHLDTARYLSLGGPAFTGYSAALRRLAHA